MAILKYFSIKSELFYTFMVGTWFHVCLYVVFRPLVGNCNVSSRGSERKGNNFARRVQTFDFIR